MLLWLKFTAEIHTLNIIQFKINYAPNTSLSEYSPLSNSDEVSFPLSLFTITPIEIYLTRLLENCDGRNHGKKKTKNKT